MSGCKTFFFADLGMKHVMVGSAMEPATLSMSATRGEGQIQDLVLAALESAAHVRFTFDQSFPKSNTVLS